MKAWRCIILPPQKSITTEVPTDRNTVKQEESKEHEKRGNEWERTGWEVDLLFCLVGAKVQEGLVKAGSGWQQGGLGTRKRRGQSSTKACSKWTKILYFMVISPLTWPQELSMWWRGWSPQSCNRGRSSSWHHTVPPAGHRHTAWQLHQRSKWELEWGLYSMSQTLSLFTSPWFWQWSKVFSKFTF